MTMANDSFQHEPLAGATGAYWEGRWQAVRAFASFFLASACRKIADQFGERPHRGEDSHGLAAKTTPISGGESWVSL